MICPNCNAQVSDTQAFCGNCGAQLTPAAAPTQQTTYSAPYQPQGAAGQQYNQSPYPPGSYTQPPQQKGSDTPFGLSIAGLVCALIGLFPLGIIFAIIALVMNSKQKKNGIITNKQAPTKVMGIIGLVISAIWVVISIIFGIALITAINNGEFDDLDVTTNSNGSVTISTPSGTSVNLNSDGSVSTSSPSSGSSSTATTSGNSAATSSGGAAATTGNLASSTSAATSTNEIVGQWELESGNDQELTVETLDSMREMGFNIVLLVNGDGTFELSLFDESTTGTWSESGTHAYRFTIEGESITGTYDNSTKRLTWEEGGDQLIFRPLE